MPPRSGWCDDGLFDTQVELFDFGWVEFASVRGIKHPQFADKGRLNSDARVATVRAGPNVFDTVDLGIATPEAGVVGEVVIFDPPCGYRRESLALGHPIEGNGQLAVNHLYVFDFTSKDVLFVGVLDFKLTADKGRQ